MSGVLPTFAGLVIDMDGVLYRGNDALEGLADFIEVTAGWPRVFLTNNSTLSALDCVQKLQKMGVTVPPEEILTVSEATGTYLHATLATATPLYVIGEEPLRRAVVAAGMTLANATDARGLVVGLDRELGFGQLTAALRVLRAKDGGPSGAPFVATSFDPLLLTTDGVVPGSGAIVQALRACVAVEPVRIGKPSSRFFEEAGRRVGCPCNELLVIGDSLVSDIGGGSAVGAATVLVLSGLTTTDTATRRGDAASDLPVPDVVVSGMPELTTMLRAAQAQEDRFITAKERP